MASPAWACLIAYGRRVVIKTASGVGRHASSVGRRACGAVLVVLLVGCGHPRPVAPVVKPPPISVAGTCVARGDAEARLQEVLREHRADRSGLAIEIAGDREVSLRVVRGTGEIGLDRHYTLAPADCASAPQLLALAVDRWLTAFPEWAEPPAPPPARWFEVAVPVAVNVIASPVGVEGQAGVIVDRGDAHDRFGGSALVRTGIPQDAGTGRFREVAVLAGAAWRHRFGAWEARAEVRGGGLRVSGLGFAANAVDWIPWWEGAVAAGRRFGFGALGLELAATSLKAHATTRDGLVSEDIPLVRLGISGTFDVR